MGFWRFALCLNLNTNVVTFMSFDNLENHPKGIMGSTFVSETMLFRTVDCIKSLFFLTQLVQTAVRLFYWNFSLPL